MITGCRSIPSAACKNNPLRQTVRLELNQDGTQLTGTIDFLGSRRVFRGFVSEGPGIAGSGASQIPDSQIVVRLIQSGATFAGMIVTDAIAQSQLVSSRRYDIVTPLQRQ